MALADSTTRAYSTMFRLYLAFMIFSKSSPNQVNLEAILAFLEFLVTDHVKVSQIRNYISAIKHYSIRFDLPFTLWNHEKVNLFVKSLQKTAIFKVRLPKVIDVKLLENIILKCESTFLGTIFKAVYLTAFFGFFRLSNLVPHTVATFSKMKHITRGDVFFSKKICHHSH